MDDEKPRRLRSITRSSVSNHLVVETFDGETYELEGIRNFKIVMGSDGVTNTITIEPIKHYEALAALSATKLAKLLDGEVILSEIKVEFS